MHGSAQVPGEAHEQELQRLMDAYSGTLMGVCIVLLRDHHQAQDVVQETFVKAWRAGRLRPETEKAWLIRVAVNACRDQLRSRWFRFVDRSRPMEELPIAAPEEPDHAVLQQVMQLPLRLREVVILHYWNELSADEIASALRIDRATVYRRLASARKRLRLELEEGGTRHD